jgi:phospholipid/cholesterol/gamma-HCH transport system substrate-binding protein
MTKRILVNLVVFGLLGVVMTVWALRNVITLQALSQPYRIQAEFESSPGLQPNFDVAYLGVTIGKIRSVRLGNHKIIAELDINKGEKIPDNVTAAAGRQSAIGEPYVDLELPPGATGGPPIRHGAVIPLSRTSVAVSYGALFAATNKAVSGLNATDLKTLTHELAIGLDGRADSLRKILDGTHELTGTFAQNTELLDTLIGEITRTTTTVAAHRDELGRGLDDLTAFTDVLAQSNGELLQLRKTTPELLGRFNDLLARTRQQNECALKSLTAALPRMLSKDAVDSLRYTQQNSPQIAAILKEISPKVNGKSNLNIDFAITLAKPKPAMEYKYPLPLPTVGAIPTCPGVSMPANAVAASAKPGATVQQGAGTRKSSEPAVSARNAAQESHDSGGLGRWLLYALPLIALAILLRTMARAVPEIRRNRRKGK